MDTLFQGLTGKTGEQQGEAMPSEEHSEEHLPEKKKAGSYEVISTTVDPEIMSKIRAIASMNDIPIKEVIGVGLNMVVSKYEELHGKVRVKKPIKCDLSKIFGT